jgi:ribosomal protein L40E
MGAFESAQSFPIIVADLTPVAQDVMRHFEAQYYEVKGEQTITRGWDISVHKGGVFKTILGLKTALKIQMEPLGSTIMAKASIGFFGLQAIPTIISMFLYWPVLIPQLWGMVQQSKLDEEALSVIETSLKTHSTAGPGTTSEVVGAGLQANFCTNCGAQLPGRAKFCAECGARAA